MCCQINISKIIQIESSGDPEAVSDKNAVGLMQVTQAALDDWNRFHPEERYSLEEMKIPEKNIKVGTWYMNFRIPEMLKAYDIPDCNFTRLVAYNDGAGDLKHWFEKLNEETKGYLRKYFKQ